MVGGESLVHENSYVPLHPYVSGEKYPPQKHKNISLSKKIGGGCHGPAASSRMTPTRPFTNSRSTGTYANIRHFTGLFMPIYGYLRQFTPNINLFLSFFAVPHPITTEKLSDIIH